MKLVFYAMIFATLFGAYLERIVGRTLRGLPAGVVNIAFTVIALALALIFGFGAATGVRHG